MMREWDFPVALDATAELSVYLQIARAIAQDIRRGRLVAGDRLPGTRRLAEILGVHRNTVLAAYTELAMEGWVTTSVKRGTFVSHDVPESSARQGTQQEPAPVGGHVLGFDLPDAGDLPEPTNCGVPKTGTGANDRRPDFVFSGGLPDVRLLPARALGRAYSRALRVSWRTTLMYAEPEGHPKLRVALAKMLASTRGLVAPADRVFVTRGAQMGIWLVARALISPGDVVAVEALGYRPAWDSFRMAGARIVPIPVDEHGLSIAHLKALMTTERVRAVYVTPQHQFPTTVTLSPERRHELLLLATAHRCAIVEEDYDHEFHYEGRPVLPLAAADHAGVLIYVGTLSKVLAPGLRIGFVVAPIALMPRLAAIRSNVDLQGDHCLEYAIADLLEDGEIQRHVARMRGVYRARRDALADALHHVLADTLTFTLSSGGTALWAAMVDGIDVEAWSQRARAAGVAVPTGRRYDFHARSLPFVRLGFAALNEREIAEATRRLARCLPALGDRPVGAPRLATRARLASASPVPAVV
jgi:GntR family transcriptional regulator / MocR family aminotransferase